MTDQRDARLDAIELIRLSVIDADDEQLNAIICADHTNERLEAIIAELVAPVRHS